MPDDGEGLRRRVPSDPDDANAVEVRELDGDGGADIDIKAYDGHKMWRNLWLIKLADDDGARMPAESWGGYSENFDANSDVYTVEEAAAEDHDRWGVVGYDTPDAAPTDPQLLVLDLDVYKSGAPDVADISVDAGFAGEIEPVVVESQSGGLHVYLLVESRADVQESDFQAPDWVDLRGAAVSAHVVAPSAIPGVETAYTLRNAASIPEFDSFSEACEFIQVDGEPVIEYEGRGAGGDTVDVDFDGDAPAEMPRCYQAALQARASAEFREAHGNAWKVDTLAGQLGVALGYDIDAIVEHFREWPTPDEGFDENITRSHLRRLARKMRDRDEMTPPTAATLRSHGILDAGECCGCDLPGHVDPDEDDVSEYYRYLDVQTDSDREMLRRCLALRDEHDELEGEKPPHAAIRAIARLCELPVDDDGVVREMYDVARSQYESMTVDDLDEVMG